MKSCTQLFFHEIEYNIIVEIDKLVYYQDFILGVDLI